LKIAYFILGPESSGTRMITKAFCSLGIYGDHKHRQRMDDLNFAKTPASIVLRRSLPHGELWPAIADTITLMKRGGYQHVVPILIIRDKDATVKSQLRHVHEKDEEVSRNNVAYSIDHTYRDLAKIGLLPTIICYEPFVKYEHVRKLFFDSLGLPNPVMDFYDANEQYKEGE
jgi:hypothetical protein